ncbi:DUF2231 domain-containing protein [Spirillospora sp. NPDC050679]
MEEIRQRALERGKEPVTALAGPYGHPVHPILVTVPIGAWVASLVFDAGSHLTEPGGFLVRGSAWLIAVGVVGALVAASAGFLDLFAIPPGTPAFRTGLVHMGLNLAVTTGYAAGFVWRLGDYRHAPSVAPGKVALSAACLAVLTVSGYLGGKLAYRYGVRVADERTQARGFTSASQHTDD